MANSVKVEMVEELHGMFSRAKSAVVANYQGIDAEGIAALRVHMRSRSVDFRVVKNTLARRAVKDTSLEVLSEDFKGPISILVGFEDAVAPAKALADFAKSVATKSPEVICGVVDGEKGLSRGGSSPCRITFTRRIDFPNVVCIPRSNDQLCGSVFFFAVQTCRDS